MNSSTTTPVGFEEMKAAQIAAYFAAREGGEIEKLKLIKLIYIAEREFVSRYGHPMLFDELYSLPHGPICSSCLDGINENLNPAIWHPYISLKNNKIVTTKLAGDVRGYMDHVSDAEYDVLIKTWESFGFMSPSQLRNYTHKNYPEYVEVEDGKRLQILYRELFCALGFDNPEECENRVVEMRRSHSLMSY